MLTGSFDPATRRPFLEGLLVVPGLNASGPVSFLVDTGSDVSCLMPADGMQLGINYRTLAGPKGNTIGVGGGANPFEFRAVVIFAGNNASVFYYVIKLQVYPRKGKLLPLPSLLGRDVLDRWRMVYDPSKDRLRFTPKSWDLKANAP